MLTNAVLRNFLRCRRALMENAHSADVARFSHPQWWIDKLRVQYPEHYVSILAAANQHPPLTLRVNAAAPPSDTGAACGTVSRRTRPAHRQSRWRTAPGGTRSVLPKAWCRCRMAPRNWLRRC
jgi:16S rRNA C967 or C1407 C5-methylase (RsmB/RsmF family)